MTVDGVNVGLGRSELLLAGGVVVGAVVLFWLLSRNKGALASAVTKGAVNLASGAAGGAVIGVGEVVGLPDTTDDATLKKGREEAARGDLWAASFDLPAGEWLSAVKAKLFGPSSPTPAPDNALTGGSL